MTGEEDDEEDEMGLGLTREEKLSKASEVADRALIAVLKILGEVRRSKDVQDGEELAILQSCIPGFSLGLEFGLHVGWAVEGAVGSVHKVDAAYFSSHVHATTRLQMVASHYGVPVILSAPFQRLLSPLPRQRCRRLDVVAFPSSAGTSKPTPIFTYDVWRWSDTVDVRDPSRRTSTTLREHLGVRRSDDADSGSAIATYTSLRGGRWGGGASATVGVNARPGMGSSIVSVGVGALKRIGGLGRSQSWLDAGPSPLLTGTVRLPLLPFALMMDTCPDPDVFNKLQATTAPQAQRISLLGAADIIEHPVVPGEYSREIFAQDAELRAMWAPFDATFVELFNRGVDFYLRSEWLIAAHTLVEAVDHQTRVHHESDGRRGSGDGLGGAVAASSAAGAVASSFLSFGPPSRTPTAAATAAAQAGETVSRRPGVGGAFRDVSTPVSRRHSDSNPLGSLTLDDVARIDRPTAALLRFMQLFSFRAPPLFPGFRRLQLEL